MLVASISTCHLLWYLHLCAVEKVVVVGYVDSPTGTLVETADGGGKFEEVVLRPVVTIEAGSDPATAARLHERAHALCFIARSVNFPVRCEPEIREAEA